MNEPHSPGHFVCKRADRLVLRSFEDGVVVYDESDGSVRALTQTAGLALEICKAAGLITATEVADRLGLSEPTEDELGSVNTLLQQMKSMGFLEHVST